MKINPITNPNILRSYQAASPVKNKPGVNGGRDEVTFSEEALSFSRAMAEAKGSIEQRTPQESARIAGIANAVRNGEYKIESGKVADKMLESVLR